MYKQIKLQGYKNAFTIKAKNRRFEVVKTEVDGENRNIICITSLTSETGKEDGAITKLSENEKIKYSFVGLRDEAIKELYVCLHHYLKNVLSWNYACADIIDPIPLTEEMLLKCGFEKTYYGYKCRNGSTLNFVLKNNEISLGYFDDDDWCGIGEPIKHLHQLQNLIYSLTGEELNINL